MSHFADLFSGKSKYDAAWLMRPFNFEDFRGSKNFHLIEQRLAESYDMDDYGSAEEWKRAIREDVATVLAENFEIFQNLVRDTADANGAMNVFRAVRLGSISDLRTNKLGPYWAYAADCADTYFAGSEAGETYIIHGRVHVNDVDWRESVVLNEAYGGAECEVRVMNGARVELLGWSHSGDQTVHPLPVSEGFAGLRRR